MLGGCARSPPFFGMPAYISSLDLLNKCSIKPSNRHTIFVFVRNKNRATLRHSAQRQSQIRTITNIATGREQYIGAK